MRIIKDVNIANTGSYYGSDLKTKEPFLEEVTEESLKKISLNVRQVPLTVEHNPTQQIGYISNIRKFKNKLIGDITLYLDKDIDKVVDKYISPAWKEEQSRESMIIRKMRNNIVKKIPKDFSSSYVAEIYNENSDETYKTYNAEYSLVEEEPLEPVALADGTKVDTETGEVKSQPEF